MTDIDLKVTEFAKRVADALVEIEKDLSTDYHAERVDIFCAGEKTGVAIVPNDIGTYDLRVEEL